MKHTILLLSFVVLLVSMKADASGEQLPELLYNVISEQARPWYKEGSTARGALETDEDYSRRLRVISRAVYEESAGVTGWGLGRKALMLATVAHWREESAYALEVHEGSEHPVWTQDRGRARCLGQLQVTGLVPKSTWNRLAGVDMEATRLCARYTIKVLVAMQRYCASIARLKHESISGEVLLFRTFSAMRKGRCESTGHGAKKMALYRRMYRRL